MKIIGYAALGVFLGASAYGASQLTPETEMAFTLKDVLTYCGMVAGVGASWAHAQSQIKDARRVADEAERKADAVHRRLDEMSTLMTGIRLDMRGLQGEVRAFSDSRFDNLSHSLFSLTEQMAKRGVIPRRAEET